MGKWCTVAPLLDRHFGKGISRQISLGMDVKLSKLPDWVKDENILSILSYRNRLELQRSTMCLKYDYNASSLDENSQKAANLIHLANMALWIVKPTELSYTIRIVGEKREKWIHREITEPSGIRLTSHDHGNRLEVGDFKKARRLLLEMSGIQKNTTLWMVIWTLAQSLKADFWELRLLQHWIVLEALFGPDSPSETLFKLTQRMAIFLHGSGLESLEEFKRMKDGYAWRSKIVHGMRIYRGKKKPTDELINDLLHETETWIRNALRRIFSSKELIKNFNKKNRDEWLNEVVFTGVTGNR